MPIDEYNLNQNVNEENMLPPCLTLNDVDFMQNDVPCPRSKADNTMEQDENSLGLIISTWNIVLDPLLQSPELSLGSPTHTPRTPHRRSTHDSSPLPTPHFSDGGFSDNLGMIGSDVHDDSPDLVKLRCHTAQQKGREKVDLSKPHQPLTTLEYEDLYAEPASVVGEKRTYEQIGRQKEKPSEEDSDRKLSEGRCAELGDALSEEVEGEGEDRTGKQDSRGGGEQREGREQGARERGGPEERNRDDSYSRLE
ncbi:hypothetical protein V8D89_001233 [Ganoderma adspersum]